VRQSYLEDTEQCSSIVQVVRTMECNLGNLVADVMRHNLDFVLDRPLDCTLVNGGTLRSDMVHNNRMLKKRDLLSIMPMMDEVAVVEIDGKTLLQALEVGVSSYPKLEGRFLHVCIPLRSLSFLIARAAISLLWMSTSSLYHRLQEGCVFVHMATSFLGLVDLSIRRLCSRTYQYVRLVRAATTDHPMVCRCRTYSLILMVGSHLVAGLS
jgi:5'-nucleotidase, C-terminal domain